MRRLTVNGSWGSAATSPRRARRPRPSRLAVAPEPFDLSKVR